MLNVKEMQARRQEGERLLSGLPDAEDTVISNFGLLVARGLIQAGTQRGKGINDIVLNAFMQGTALGLRIDIRAGRVVGRR